jgi:hypothetical protein
MATSTILPPHPVSIFLCVLSILSLYLTELTVPCCDLCVHAKVDSDQPLTEPEADILKLIKRIDLRTMSTTPKEQEVIDVDQDNVDTVEKASLPLRRRERLQICRQALNHWRTRCWKLEFSDCSWGPKALMPDTIVTKLATRVDITTVENLKDQIPEWDFRERYGTDVLTIIQQADTRWKEAHERELQSRKENRRAGKDVERNTATPRRPALQPTPTAAPYHPALQPIPVSSIPPSQPFTLPAQQVPGPQGYYPPSMPYLVQYFHYPAPTASQLSQGSSQPPPPPHYPFHPQVLLVPQPGYSFPPPQYIPAYFPPHK